MLIDTGSEITFITASLVQQLKLHREASVIPIIGIGGTHSGHTRGVVSVKLRSMHSSDIVSIKAHILSKLMPTLPSFTPPNISLSHLQGLPLADPEFLSPESIDLILGADIYGQLIREQIKRGPQGTPIAQNTVFGWIVLGPMDPSKQSAGLVHHAAVDHGYQELQDLLTQFWVQEEVSGSGESHLTPDEQECETHFLTTHKRDSDGRYVVRLPVKTASGTLGGSFHTASSCLHRLQCKLNRDSSYRGLYDTFLGEYESLGHMTRVSDSGISLNDILHTGAKLQRDISDVLLWVRRHRFVFATDIVKMFRQIRVHETPFLAGRALDPLVTDEGGKYPEAVAPLTKGRYVDDIYGGADQLADLITQVEQLIGICTAGCFPLAKWQSNHPELLTAVGATSSTENARVFEEWETKVLGLAWLPHTDVFKFTVHKYTAGDGITKRIILSEIAQLYDPLGFLSPVTIRAKVLLQRLWLEKLNWDDLVSTEVRNSWVAFRQELSHIGTVSVPRWLNIATGTSVELHGFSDASQLAMGAAVYVRVSGAGNQTTVSLVCAKTKVAPIKRLTIPRLELAAAVLLAKLTHHVQNVLGLDDSRVYLWTASMVTLTWVTSHPSRWKDFVRNRVSLAQELVPRAQWRFTPGRDNPADCASRGLTISQLARHSSWWDGPHWLAKDSFHWPTHRIGTGDAAAVEERPGLTLSLATSPSPVYDLILKYSSLTRLLRITSWLFKVITNLKRAGDGTSGSANITPGDLENSRLYWVKAIQGAYFTSELKTLTSGYTLPKSHPITRLTGFIDHQGILRVGGRLKHSALQPDCKHSVILPRDSPLTALLIADAHERTLHGGTQLTLAYLRQSCWIIGGRGPVRSYILRCVRCARFRALKAQQLMGQLPISRVTPARPFLFSGVDYAGPVSLKSWRGRGSKCHKGWLCIFVCFATSAMHLEVVTDLTTDGFLAALRRFTGRRGIPHTIQSDCGTNFQGAAAELRQLFKTGTRESELIQHTGATDGIKWVFNPPGAPHIGGKWEAAVKSVKYHLRRTIGDASLTFEELTTLLTQIEGILNSRPLEPLSDDPDDHSVLTPGHFLIGDTLTSIPEPSLRDVSQGRLTRWQWLQERVQYYWEHWSSGYLQRQQAISKWHHPSHDIRVGSMVLLMNENTSPTKWPRARVTQLYTGKDGLTRVVTLKTATTTLTRPITKLALLPVPQPGSIDSTAADGGRNVQD
ncbi:uncharacterized protein [Venturia canescens]|uniref:uncharacterized protein n=1 Tax=Venturia canescens TaxID=32260 RepID=UPI001C9C9256|nr:uncharacterized protein LOC122416235 [Venturia canescens]